MGTPFLGEIKICSFTIIPQGWAQCNGQLLPINQNQALFSLLGTNYGGNGSTTFGLPNLQGRVPIHVGGGFTLGQVGGEVAHTLTTSELTAHTHLAIGTGTAADLGNPGGNFWASGGQQIYYAPPPATAPAAMAPQDITNVGGSQAHANLSPFLTLMFIIALQGVFPSQN